MKYGAFKSKSRRGIIVPLIAVSVLLFLAVLTIIVDGGRMVVSHSELQGLSQVVALSAVTASPDGEVAVKKNVEKFFHLNNISRCSYTVEVSGKKVSILLKRKIPLLLSKRVGIHSYTVTARAVSRLSDGKARLEK